MARRQPHPLITSMAMSATIALSLAACGSSSPAADTGSAAPATAAAPADTTATPADTTAATGAATEVAGSDAVTINDFAFSPATLDVEVGSTVTWTNNQSVPHTATADDGAWDSGKLDQDATFSFTFDTAGTFTYHCSIHPTMTASITVT